MKTVKWPLLGLTMSLSWSAVAGVDGMTVYSKGGANPAAMACVMCHGAQGEGMGAAGFPRLAGLSAAHMQKQLADYAAGTRGNPIMQPIAQALSAAEVEAVSQWLAAKPAPAVKAVNRSSPVNGLGETLALRGAWERNIPECVACHGPGGMGVGEAFPPLSGQSAQYLIGQMQAWRQGTRKNDPNDLMGHVARTLNDEEIKAVAEYFAGLPALEVTP